MNCTDVTYSIYGNNKGEIMQGFIRLIEDKFVPIAAKVGNQKHLVAIRDSFASLMPLVMAGAIAVLLNNVFFVPWGLLADKNLLGPDHGFILWANEHIAPFFSAIDAGTLSLMALALVIALSYNRAKSEGQDEIITSLVSLGSFMMLGALSRTSEIAGHVTNYLGAQGIFIGMLVGLVGPAIYFTIVNKNWVIKLPDTVPPAVARGFSGIIPGFITLCAFSAVNYVFTKYLGSSIFTWFETTIGSTMSQLSQGLPAVILTSTLIPLLWFFGLHGANLLEAFMQPVYGALQNENISNFVANEGATEGLHKWVRGSWDAYVFHGGSGATIGLVIAILLVGKLKDQKEVARLGLGPSIFMINEPILFGIPVVLNPIYLIPFVLNQPILATIAYLATEWNFAGPIVNAVPWTTPPVLNALLATNFSIGAGVIAAINLALSFVIYLPFVFVANKYGEDQGQI